ncbi:MAG: hypothetical protein H5T61_14405 [Thermoflexales bacterium]|nr:hypothetical protein [Thermoflexales bacterium]
MAKNCCQRKHYWFLIREQKRYIWEKLVLLVALGIATYFRLVRIDTTWMSPDQSTLLSLAMDIASGERFPLVANQSSAGFAHPALPVYLYAFPILLTHQVVSAAVLTALLNVLSVGIGYLYARRYLGQSASLVFLALYTLSPWSVHFSRLIWNPVIIPFFAALALCLLTVLVTGDQRFVVWVGIALALIGMFHSHLVSLSLIIAVGAIGLLFHRRIRIWWAAIAFLFIALSFAPYVEAQTASFPLRVPTGEPVQVNIAPFLIAGDLISARGLFLAVEGWKTAEILLRGWLWISIIWLGLITLRYGRKAWENSISAPQSSRIVLFFWIIGPLVALTYHRHYLQHHYFLFLYPAAYLAMAALVEDLGVCLDKFLLPRLPTKTRQIYPIIGKSVLMLLLGVVSFWSFLVSRSTLRQEWAQTCLQERHVRAAVEVIRDNIEQLQIPNLVVLSDGIDALSSTFGFISALLPSDLSIRFVRIGNGILVPRAPALYFVAGRDEPTEALLSQAGRLLSVLELV